MQCRLITCDRFRFNEELWNKRTVEVVPARRAFDVGLHNVSGKLNISKPWLLLIGRRADGYEIESKSVSGK
jgi:hypothetical protein